MLPAAAAVEELTEKNSDLLINKTQRKQAARSRASSTPCGRACPRRATLPPSRATTSATWPRRSSPGRSPPGTRSWSARPEEEVDAAKSRRP